MDHHPTVSVSLTVKDAADALDFYQKALSAVETYRLEIPGGGVAHAEFEVAGTKMFISGEAPEWGAQAMSGEDTASCLFTIIVEECDACYEKALKAGATSVSKPQDQFWGLRSAVIRDPYGYRWSFGQVIEVVSPEEMDRRAREIWGGGE